MNFPFKKTKKQMQNTLLDIKLENKLVHYTSSFHKLDSFLTNLEKYTEWLL